MSGAETNPDTLTPARRWGGIAVFMAVALVLSATARFGITHGLSFDREWMSRFYC